jgi:hypothetical protein
MSKVSIKASVRKAKTQDSKARDSFQNFALGLGMGTQNLSTFNHYGFNPMTRQRTELEWAYRGSWVAGVAVDVIADDMTREGVDLQGQLEPDEVKQIDELAIQLKVWERINQTIKWSRLYGGAICVMLIDGQDMSRPLRLDTVGPDQFKGLLVLDRWMVSPSLNDLVTEMGPDIGCPKFYTVEINAPALRGQKVHYSRCLRLLGDELPYQQAQVENLWGMSVLERPWDRVTSFDAATTGASQQVHKSYLRYFKIKDYRKVVSGLGGPQALKGLMEMVANMRLFASNEGISLIDAEDDMVTTQATNFTGISDVLLQLAQHISGAYQIPLVRLLGQSPAGLNSAGESELKTYYDGIKQRQIAHLLVMATKIYRCLAASLRIKIQKGFSLSFKPLWQMSEPEKAEVAAKDTATVMEVHSSGIISDKTALQALQHSSRKTGRWEAIDNEIINAASDEIMPKAEAMSEDLPQPPNPNAAAKPEPGDEPA